MNRLSPPSIERFRPFMTPPWVLAATAIPVDIAIIAPDSALSCSLGSRVHPADGEAGAVAGLDVHGGPPSAA